MLFVCLHADSEEVTLHRRKLPSTAKCEVQSTQNGRKAANVFSVTADERSTALFVSILR